MMYHVCPYCGDNLDPGEKCDCVRKNNECPERKSITRQYQYITAYHDLSKLTFITQLDGKVVIA